MIYEEGLLHFLRNADNVYRTKHFIVKQVIEVQEHSVEGNSIVSFDTYYRRTPKRDLAYKHTCKNSRIFARLLTMISSTRKKALSAN